MRQEYLVKENTSNENRRGLFLLVVQISMSKSYVLSVWLALLVHTGGHGIHVCFVCISLVSWFLLLFDVILVVSMHDRQDPEDAAVTSFPFGYNKVNRRATKFKTNQMKWLSGLSVCHGNTIQCSCCSFFF